MKRLIILSCLLIVVVVGFSLALLPSPPAPPASVIVMPLPYSIPRQRISLFDAWVPRNPSWAWLWRLKEQIQGRRKTFDLATTIIDFTSAGDSFLTNFPAAKPAFTNTNGLKIWLMGDPELTALRGGLKRVPGADVLSAGRITTADGMEAQLFSGNTISINGSPGNVGMAINLLPHVRRDSTDLTTIITFSETITNQPGATLDSSQTSTISIQTDFAVAARIQIPKATGVFLLDTGSGAPNHKRIGVILSVNPPPPKK